MRYINSSSLSHFQAFQQNMLGILNENFFLITMITKFIKTNSNCFSFYTDVPVKTRNFLKINKLSSDATSSIFESEKLHTCTEVKLKSRLEFNLPLG